MTKKPAKQRKLTKKDKQLATKIRHLRKQRGLSQWDLSKSIDTNVSYIAFIETGQRGLSIPMLHKIAKALKVEVKDLFDY